MLNKKMLGTLLAFGALASGQASAEALQWTGTVSSAGCTISAIQAGTIVDAGGNVFSSATADGGTPVQFQVDTTDGLNSLTISNPTVMLDGTTPVAMQVNDANAYEVTEQSQLGLVDASFTAPIALTATGTYNFEINYSDTTTASMQSGNYVVDTIITCAP